MVQRFTHGRALAHHGNERPIFGMRAERKPESIAIPQSPAPERIRSSDCTNIHLQLRLARTANDPGTANGRGIKDRIELAGAPILEFLERVTTATEASEHAILFYISQPMIRVAQYA
jgi:hypothetical protein